MTMKDFSKENNEWLSSLVDNEVKSYRNAVSDNNEQALDVDLSALTDDDKDAWSRYHLIGDAMRDELPESLNLDLTARIEASIANEAPLQMVEDNKAGLFASFAAQWQRLKDSMVVKQFGQVAVAASVAMVAIMGVRQYQVETPNTAVEQGPLQVLQTNGPIAGVAEPVSYSTYNPGREVQMPQSDIERRQEIRLRQQRINEMLTDHKRQVKKAAAQQAAVEQNKQQSGQ